MWQNEFKPDVVEWGQRGILECAKILDQLKAPLPDEVEAMAGQEVERESPISTGPEAPVQANGEKGTDGLTDAGSVLSELPDIADEATPSKRQKELTLEEYEAMLDAENAPGGFLEGGDIPGARHHDA